MINTITENHKGSIKRPNLFYCVWYDLTINNSVKVS